MPGRSWKVRTDQRLPVCALCMLESSRWKLTQQKFTFHLVLVHALKRSLSPRCLLMQPDVHSCGRCGNFVFNTGTATLKKYNDTVHAPRPHVTLWPSAQQNG